jgi:hypothetical protein
MMNKNIKYLICAALLLTGIACKKLYQPTIISSGNSYLVVEGFINPGNEATMITISHTTELADAAGRNSETGATVTVEGGGSTWPLTELGGGSYYAPALNLDISKKYHLRIKLANGQEYLSDDAEVKVTPPIDDINYEIKPNGLHINASTHDAANKTHYYRWEYDETWKFHSKFLSSYKVVNGEVLPRTIEDQVYTCYNTHASSTVLLANTKKLTADVVSKVPITNIVPSSEKISVRYSILLKQYALTKEAFEFWENLRKNTEQLGSIFDALPSEIKGNIHNTANPDEPVVGYISVNTVAQKRIFIDKDDLPNEWLIEYPYDCKQDSTLYLNPVTKVDDVASFIISGIYTPTYAILGPPPASAVIGYGRTNPPCADCTLRGVKSRPAYWIEK